jgi:Ca2+-binding EF-hand superfamily protein
MSMSIGSSTSTTSAMMFSRAGATRQRPDASKLADDLFSKLDTQNKGYLEASDLASALGTGSSTSSTSTGTGTSASTASTDAVFKALDSDSDGKLTKNELTTGLKKVQEQLDSQFQAMRTKGKGDMPPPPPPQDADGDSDGSTSSSQTFDPADTNKDGTVSAVEAQAYKQASTSSTDTTSTDTTAAASSSDIASAVASLMQKVMEPHKHEHGGKGGKDDGLTVDQMNEIASSTTDTDLANNLKTLASNFDAADSNKDGKVTRDEARTYQEKNQATASNSDTSATTTTDTSSTTLDKQVMKRIMELVHTYSNQSSSKAQSTLSTVSVSA